MAALITPPKKRGVAQIGARGSLGAHFRVGILKGPGSSNRLPAVASRRYDWGMFETQLLAAPGSSWLLGTTVPAIPLDAKEERCWPAHGQDGSTITTEGGSKVGDRPVPVPSSGHCWPRLGLEGGCGRDLQQRGWRSRGEMEDA